MVWQSDSRSKCTANVKTVWAKQTHGLANRFKTKPSCTNVWLFGQSDTSLHKSGSNQTLWYSGSRSVRIEQGLKLRSHMYIYERGKTSLLYYGMCIMQKPWSHSIIVMRNPDFRLPSVAILSSSITMMTAENNGPDNLEPRQLNNSGLSKRIILETNYRI